MLRKGRKAVVLARETKPDGMQSSAERGCTRGGWEYKTGGREFKGRERDARSKLLRSRVRESSNSSLIELILFSFLFFFYILFFQHWILLQSKTRSGRIYIIRFICELKFTRRGTNDELLLIFHKASNHRRVPVNTLSSILVQRRGKSYSVKSGIVSAVIPSLRNFIA